MINDFEDFCTWMYVIVDDIWQQIAPFFKRPGPAPLCSDSELLTMVLVGGMGSLWGSVFGALLLTVLPEVLHAVKEYNVLVYGLILMGVLVYFPHGLLPGVAAALGTGRKDIPPDSKNPPVPERSARGGDEEIHRPAGPRRQAEGQFHYWGERRG